MKAPNRVSKLDYIISALCDLRLYPYSLRKSRSRQPLPNHKESSLAASSHGKLREKQVAVIHQVQVQMQSLTEQKCIRG